jgi:hypothetical protein
MINHSKVLSKSTQFKSWENIQNHIKLQKIWSFFFVKKEVRNAARAHITHPHPRLTLCTQNSTNANSRESKFVEFCVDGINLYGENNFIDSLGLGRDSNPDPSAPKPSECTTTPSTSSNYEMKVVFNSFISLIVPSVFLHFTLCAI